MNIIKQGFPQFIPNLHVNWKYFAISHFTQLIQKVAHIEWGFTKGSKVLQNKKKKPKAHVSLEYLKCVKQVVA